MKTTNTTGSRARDENDSCLALHIRRHRQWYPNRSLTQTELARLAGVSTRHLSKLEQATMLPSAVSTLLAIALALRLRIDDLISPRVMGLLSDELETRRRNLALDGPTKPTNSTTASYGCKH